jgi:hypothetical protein
MSSFGPDGAGHLAIGIEEKLKPRVTPIRSIAMWAGADSWMGM